MSTRQSDRRSDRHSCASGAEAMIRAPRAAARVCRRVAYATRVQAGLELRELNAGEFLANLDACTSVYAAAMDPPEYQLPGRHSIMERHAGYSAFRAIAATWPA